MSWKPEPCESCAAGKPRAHCATFPRPCEDLIEIYESGVADERERCAQIATFYGAAHIAEQIRSGS
jgi:hypothetical protein